MRGSMAEEIAKESRWPLLAGLFLFFAAVHCHASRGSVPQESGSGRGTANPPYFDTVLW